MYGQYSVRYFCELFGKSRQGYYAQQHCQQKQSLRDTLVLKLVREIRLQLPRCGVSKLQHLLQPSFAEHGIKMGRDGLYDLLGAHGYLVRYRRRKPYTTDSSHRFKKYPNLIRDMTITAGGQLWVSDITYLRLTKGYCYLSIITDAYSRKIVGYKLHPDLGSLGPITALKMAVSQRTDTGPLVHHSDRGTQYCCREYVEMIGEYGIRLSMTENGDPYENAIAERVNGILKEEMMLNRTFENFTQAATACSQAIDTYNELRPHASCDYLTPSKAHQCRGVLRQRWRRNMEVSVKPQQEINTDLSMLNQD
jgi:putative transposase